MIPNESASTRPAPAALGLAATMLLAFSVVALPCALFPRSPGSSTIPWGQAGVFVGLLAGATLWSQRGVKKASLGRLAAVSALLLAVTVSASAFVAPSRQPVLMPGVMFVALFAAVGIAAGLALTASYANSPRCGVFTSAYLAGALLAWSASRGGALSADPALLLLAAGAPAALASLLLSLQYSGLLLRVASGFVLLVSLSPVILGPAGPALRDLTIAKALPAPASVAEDLRWLLVIGAAILALFAPSNFIVGKHRDQALGLARLHLMALLSGVAGILLTWAVLVGQSSFPSAGALSPWLAFGALLGAVGVDSWPTGRLSLTRASIGVASAAIACLILSWLVEHGLPSQLAAVAAALALAIGILLSLELPAVATTGLLVGPVHSLWLWAGAALAATATAAFLVNTPAGFARSPLLLSAAGVVPALLFLLVASDLRLPKTWPSDARRWVRREWRAKEVPAPPLARPIQFAADYPIWLTALRLFTYIGYAPLWTAVGLCRGLWYALCAVVSTLFGVLTGISGSLLQLGFGKPQATTAQLVTIEEPGPVIVLSPAEEQRHRAEEAAQREGTMGHFLSRPILWLSARMQRLSDLISGRQRQPEEQPQAEETPADPDIVTETITVGPPPDLVPGAMDSDAFAREQALRRRSQYPVWAKWLQGSVGRAMALVLGNRLTPDTAEAWDPRTFRCEMIGPRGRRFELTGYLWKSRRRCGCVVTVPILSGRSEKAVEVGIRHRQLRHLVQDDPDQLKRTLLRAAFRMAAWDLNMGLSASRTVVCESPREDLIEPHQDRQCELIESLPGGGHRCRQPLAQDPARGGTSLSACDGCTFPEIWVRCANLDLKGTTGFTDDSGELRRQAFMLCRLTEQMVEFEDCPGRECFSPSLLTRIIPLDYKHTR